MRTIDQLEKVTSAEDAALLVINNAAGTSTNAITFSDLKSQVLDGNAASATKAVSADSATDAGKATNDANGNNIVATYAPIASPVFTGTPKVPTPNGDSVDTQAANKKYVNDRITEAIGNVIQFKVNKVAALPDPSAGEANTIYFVPASNTADNNIFNEFMLIDGKWEQIGSSVVILPASLPASGVADEADMDYGDLDS